MKKRATLVILENRGEVTINVEFDPPIKKGEESSLMLLVALMCQAAVDRAKPGSAGLTPEGGKRIPLGKSRSD